MSPFDLHEYPQGSIGFAGSVRGSDECGHNVFNIKIAEHPLLYGEWTSVFDQDQNTFNVEILSFGYTDERNIPITDPKARTAFSIDEKNVISILIENLFNNKLARSFFNPFRLKHADFKGKISFSPNWIITKTT